MSNVIRIEDAKTPRREYLKRCAEWVSKTLKEVINTEQTIIDDMEDIIEGYAIIKKLEKQGASKQKRLLEFEAESTEAIINALKVVSDITSIMAKYDLMHKEEDIKND